MVAASSDAGALTNLTNNLDVPFSLASMSFCSISFVVDSVLLLHCHLAKNSSEAKVAAMGLPRANVTRVRPSWIALKVLGSAEGA